MAAKPTQLSAGLVARKGQAAPVSVPTVASSTAEAAARTALTVKLDDERYRRLKNLCARRPRRSGQAVMVAALDAYLAALDA